MYATGRAGWWNECAAFTDSDRSFIKVEPRRLKTLSHGETVGYNYINYPVKPALCGMTITGIYFWRSTMRIRTPGVFWRGQSTYTQGQSPEPRIREYFYYLDHQGQVYSL